MVNYNFHVYDLNISGADNNGTFTFSAASNNGGTVKISETSDSGGDKLHDTSTDPQGANDQMLVSNGGISAFNNLSEAVYSDTCFQVIGPDASIFYMYNIAGAGADPSDGLFVSTGEFVDGWSYVFVVAANPDTNLGTYDIGDVYYSNLVVCFTRGTMIEGANGLVAIEDLDEGDMVRTMDRGMQPVRWIGSKKVAAKGDLAPILIKAGALGNERDLRVSPQHRMLLSNWQAELLFGEREVLATAKSLVNDNSILVEEGGEVEYFHMIFDQHEIVFAEGIPSESFHPGEVGINAVEKTGREEIFTLFPELRANAKSYGDTARMTLKHYEGKSLAEVGL